MFLSISDLYNDDYGVDGGDDEDDGAIVQKTRWGITFRKSRSRNVAPQDLPMSSPERFDKISTLDLMLIILAELDSIEGEENEFSEWGLMMMMTAGDFDNELVL